MKVRKFVAAASFAVALAVANQASAGPIFLTGHDPDFHAVESGGARNLLKSGLRGNARFLVGHRSAADWIWRALRRTFKFRL